MDLFDKDAYSDVTVSFSGRQIKAHKVLLCQTSDYFKKLCGPDARFQVSGILIIVSSLFHQNSAQTGERTIIAVKTITAKQSHQLTIQTGCP